MNYDPSFSYELTIAIMDFRQIAMKCNEIRHMKTILNATLYTTLIKQPRFGNLSKPLPIVNMKILSPDSDLTPKL